VVRTSVNITVLKSQPTLPRSQFCKENSVVGFGYSRTRRPLSGALITVLPFSALCYTLALFPARFVPTSLSLQYIFLQPVLYHYLYESRFSVRLATVQRVVAAPRAHALRAPVIPSNERRSERAPTMLLRCSFMYRCQPIFAIIISCNGPLKMINHCT
jgi:hypothetical protein